MGFLNKLKTLTSVGKQVVPIFTAVRSGLGISIVTFFYVLVFAHTYWVLNRYDAWKSFMLIWELGLMGAYEFEQLDGGDGDGSEVVGAPVLHTYIKFMFLGVSFGLSIIIKNIFVGVMCAGYDEARARAWSLFLHTRAKNIVGTECSLQAVQNLLGLRGQDDRKYYLYYCVEKSKSPNDEPVKTLEDALRTSKKLAAAAAESDDDDDLDDDDVRQILREEIGDLHRLAIPFAERMQKLKAIPPRKEEDLGDGGGWKAQADNLTKTISSALEDVAEDLAFNLTVFTRD